MLRFNDGTGWMTLHVVSQEGEKGKEETGPGGPSSHWNSLLWFFNVLRLSLQSDTRDRLLKSPSERTSRAGNTKYLRNTDALAENRTRVVQYNTLSIYYVKVT